MAVCVWVVLRLTEGAAPAVRYVVAGVGVAGALFAFVAGVFGGGVAGVPVRLMATTGPLPVAIGGASFSGAEWARPLSMVWLCGVMLLSLRTVGGWVYLRLLIRRATVRDWPEMATLCARMGVRRGVELRTTGRVDSPFTAGFWRPVIVMPVATLAGLPADQLEAVLLHELAHIRRHDYLAEWMLQVIETVLFYHPAIWWMSSMMRRERERACDDMAIASGVERGCYAEALVRLEEMRVPMGANGWAGSDLRGRVMRVLGRPSRTPAWPVLAVLALALAAPFAPLMVAQVPKPYSMWLNEDVTYIIEPAERRRFESLADNAEREQFIEQFWKRRDPTPATMENERKEEHYRRISYSNELFKEAGKPGWATERGRTYIVFGPPDEREVHTDPWFEQWRYSYVEGRGKNVVFTFGKR
jgi:GWxTD domain-containing protein